MKKGSFENMKKQNQKNILKLIKDRDQISRIELSKSLGISKATVSNLVKELITETLVQETSRGKSSGGRKPIFLKLNPSGAYIIGLEWGINSIKAVLLNFEAEILQKDKVMIKEKSLSHYIKISTGLIKKYSTYFNLPQKLIGIGIGIHGLVDPEKGKSIFAPHFNWNQVNIKKILSKKYQQPIFIDNDVRMMAAGEIWLGRDNFVFINTGSGIGGALVFNSELYYGNSYAAGELGHLKLIDDGPQCHCGKKGCLEALAAKESIINRYQKLKQSKGKIKFDKIINNYQKGESEALIVIDDALKYFARAISNLINILNPEAIVIGGLFAEYEKILIDPLTQIVGRETITPTFKDLIITKSYYSNFAGAVGAANRVLNNFFKKL